MTSPDIRASDRWVTPGVIIVGLLVVGLVLVVLVAATAWLTHEGVDVDPMLQLMREWATTAAAIGALLLQLANRSSVTKTERNTGVMAGALYEVADAMPRPRPPARHADPDDTRYLETRGAPAARGS